MQHSLLCAMLLLAWKLLSYLTVRSWRLLYLEHKSTAHGKYSCSWQWSQADNRSATSWTKENKREAASSRRTERTNWYAASSFLLFMIWMMLLKSYVLWISIFTYCHMQWLVYSFFHEFFWLLLKYIWFMVCFWSSWLCTLLSEQYLDSL